VIAYRHIETRRTRTARTCAVCLLEISPGEVRRRHREPEFSADLHLGCAAMVDATHDDENDGRFGYEDLAQIAEDDGWTFDQETKTWTPPT